MTTQIFYRFYITDKNNVEVFNIKVSDMGVNSALKTLKGKIDIAKRIPDLHANDFDHESSEVKWVEITKDEYLSNSYRV